MVICNFCCRKTAVFSSILKRDVKELGNLRRWRSVEKQRGATGRLD
jgi:hypothetical protein